MSFIKALEFEFRQNSNSDEAIPMENYMKNNFKFLGIKTQARREINKKIASKYKQEIKDNYRNIALDLYKMQEREFHQCAIDILVKEMKNDFQQNDIKLIEKMLITYSWWDSVDVIAKYLVGGYLKKFPEKINEIIDKFSNSNNLWLNRTTIIFQLDYKENTNFELLKAICDKFKYSNEFFIQKAIGWALRDYSRFNTIGVLDFVNTTELKPLSNREAIRNIKS